VLVLLSGVAFGLELGLDGPCMESDEAGGGDDVSDGALVELGGALDCIELSELGTAVSEPVACCREQAAASASELRDKSNKPRFMGHLGIRG
jgi:hypothetical protein